MSAPARGSAALALALVAHAAIALAAARLPASPLGAVPHLDTSLVWLEPVELRAEASEPSPLRVEAAVRETTPSPRTSRSRTRGGAGSTSVASFETLAVDGVSIDAAVGSQRVDVDLGACASARIEPEREVPRTIDLDPGRVARALVLGAAEGPLAPPQEGVSTQVHPLGEREAEALLTGDLGRRAMAKAYVTPRRAIRLSPHPDGTFTYDGSGFDATIRPDGTVVFRDRDDATIDTPTLGQTQPMTDVTGAPLDSAPLFRDAPIAGIQIGGTFDGDSALARARGEDPHRFERERFLEETEDLRARLEDEARARDLARADRRRRAARDADPP